MIHKKMHQQEGLTLIELLITIAVIAIIAAISLPTFTNVVSTTRDKATEQTTKDIQKFVSKWTAAGTLSYDDATQTFAGYADLDGDGTVDADEKIEELTIGSEFDVYYGGNPATSSDDITPDYTVTLPASTATDFTAGSSTTTVSVSYTAPTQTVSLVTVDGDPYASDTGLDIIIQAISETGDEAAYTGYTIEVITAGDMDFTFPTDWSTATVYSAPQPASTPNATVVSLTGLSTTSNYYFRFAAVNSEGTGPFSETFRLNYSTAVSQWIRNSDVDGTNYGTES